MASGSPESSCYHRELAKDVAQNSTTYLSALRNQCAPALHLAPSGDPPLEVEDEQVHDASTVIMLTSSKNGRLVPLTRVPYTGVYRRAPQNNHRSKFDVDKLKESLNQGAPGRSSRDKGQVDDVKVECKLNEMLLQDGRTKDRPTWEHYPIWVSRDPNPLGLNPIESEANSKSRSSGQGVLGAAAASDGGQELPAPRHSFGFPNEKRCITFNVTISTCGDYKRVDQCLRRSVYCLGSQSCAIRRATGSSSPPPTESLAEVQRLSVLPESHPAPLTPQFSARFPCMPVTRLMCARKAHIQAPLLDPPQRFNTHRPLLKFGFYVYPVGHTQSCTIFPVLRIACNFNSTFGVSAVSTFGRTIAPARRARARAPYVSVALPWNFGLSERGVLGVPLRDECRGDNRRENVNIRCQDIFGCYPIRSESYLIRSYLKLDRLG
ncbi:hypothetical protein FB451DRAFT_1173309 [Mycena latifolia]|nr:hypothetical protein FB451DRAFT_1173309 [Mycena latifolia]